MATLSAARAQLSDPAILQRLSELRRNPSPPQAVKDVLIAVLIALGHPKPVWADVLKLMQACTLKALAARLTLFDVDTEMTLAQTRRLTASGVATWDLKMMAKKSGAVMPLALWVMAVFEYASAQMRMLSNFAVLSPPLAKFSYAVLFTKYQRQPFLSPIDICWRPIDIE